MKNIKCLVSVFTAAALLLTAGCSNGETDGGNDNGSGVSGSEPVAYIENLPEETDDTFTITYDDWHNEYSFYMARSGYTEEDNPDEALAYRRSIIQYQTQERIVLYLAAQMGITAETLTQEELDAIDESVQSDWLSWCESYETEAIEALGDSYTDEELYDKEFELFSEFLAGSGLTPEIFITWQTNATIQDKFVAAISETISDQDVQDFFQETVNEAKEMYETNLPAFETSYTSFYVPEGTRIIQQIFVMIDEDTANEVTAYRNDGDDQKADSILSEALEKVRFRIEEAYEKLENGEDWYEVQAEYNDDVNGDNVDYTVYPKSSYVSEDVIQAAMDIDEIGGFSGIIVSDSGYFILYYKDDAVLSDEAMQDLLEQAREYMEDQAAYNKVVEFSQQYPYIYDYELLNIDPPEDITEDTDTDTDNDADADADTDDDTDSDTEAE